MTPPPFVSYAQNAEDVVLRRALGDLPTGHYLEIGANDPTEDSISRSFYDRGWSGITVEPMAQLVEAHRLERPRDTQVHAVAGRPGTERAILHEITGTGLSTTIDSLRDAHEKAGFSAADVEVRSLTVDQILESSNLGELHFVVIDTEGSETDVLAGFDLRRWRPWVLVVESTAPNSTMKTHDDWEPELLARGYEFCLFDGLSRFYVALEKADLLRAALSYPACVLDNYVSLRLTNALREREELLEQTMHWRMSALTRWAEAVSHGVVMSRNAGQDAKLEQARKQVALMQNSLSWRVTRPLRGVRRVIDLTRGR